MVVGIASIGIWHSHRWTRLL